MVASDIQAELMADEKVPCLKVEVATAASNDGGSQPSCAGAFARGIHGNWCLQIWGVSPYQH